MNEKGTPIYYEAFPKSVTCLGKDSSHAFNADSLLTGKPEGPHTEISKGWRWVSSPWSCFNIWKEKLATVGKRGETKKKSLPTGIRQLSVLVLHPDHF